VRPSFGRRRESSVSHVPSALDGSDEEKDANAKVKAALKDDDSSYDDDEYDDFSKMARPFQSMARCTSKKFLQMTRFRHK
jgi:hypothetical protein